MGLKAIDIHRWCTKMKRVRRRQCCFCVWEQERLTLPVTGTHHAGPDQRARHLWNPVGGQVSQIRLPVSGLSRPAWTYSTGNPLCTQSAGACDCEKKQPLHTGPAGAWLGWAAMRGLWSCIQSALFKCLPLLGSSSLPEAATLTAARCTRLSTVLGKTQRDLC